MLDSDAAGHGWFIDSTPTQDEEFVSFDSTLRATESSPAAGRMDLLTVVMHELGHVLGLADTDGPAGDSDLMIGTLLTGMRRNPASDWLSDVDGTLGGDESMEGIGLNESQDSERNAAFAKAVDLLLGDADNEEEEEDELGVLLA